jgi:hypothetical protein
MDDQLRSLVECELVADRLRNGDRGLEPAVSPPTFTGFGPATLFRVLSTAVMTILFLHGWNSVPGGVKPTYLRDHGHIVVNPKLPDDDFDAALRVAQAEFDRYRPDVVVGSSRGGALAMSLERNEVPLVLLCPAWKKYGNRKKLRPNAIILHSRADDVVPFADSEELVRASGLPASTLLEIGTDHRLADPEPLAAMLKACESAAVEA